MSETSVPAPIVDGLQALRRGLVTWVRRYHRLVIDTPLPSLDEPVLFVANHGFGGIFDLNVFAAYAVFDELQLTRPVTALTHQLAWTLKVGRFLEPLGSRPASAESARDAIAAGHHVMVMPGGDLDAGKSFADRNTIQFGGRRGFARLAMDLDVPIVPIVPMPVSRCSSCTTVSGWRRRCGSTAPCGSRPCPHRCRSPGVSMSGWSGCCHTSAYRRNCTAGC